MGRLSNGQSLKSNCSWSIDKDGVVMGRYSPVVIVEVLIGVVLLVVGKERVELQALLEVLGGFQASNVL